ncbi:MAG: FtsX-like permease family protein [Peptococcaceae bacterium]|nr:FtsX-like permease family protein [Peptococcaceae bacterium]
MIKLFHKTLRDILSAKGQFISIGLVTALGVAFFAGLFTVSESLSKNIDAFYEATGFADIWAFYAGADDSTTEVVNRINGVSGAEKRLRLDGVSNWNNDDKSFIVYSITKDINTFYISDGRLPESKYECAVNRQLVEANGIKMGDVIPVTLNGESCRLTVTASILSPEFVNAIFDTSRSSNLSAPDFKNFGLLYIHSDMARELSGGSYNEVVITTLPDTDKSKITDALARTNGFIYSYLRENQTSYSVVDFKVKSIDNISRILPIVFFLVASALIFISMSRLIASQRGQIGVIKALGKSKSAIMWHYLSFPIITGILGGMVGGVLGATAFPLFVLWLFSTYFVIPPVTLYGGLMFAFAGIILAILFGMAAAYLSCRKMLKSTAARLMRPEPPKNARKIWLEKRKGLWRLLSYESKLIWRNVLLNKRRAVLGSVGVIGGCGLILAAVGLYGTMNFAIYDMYDNIMAYDMQVVLSQPLSHENKADFRDDGIQNAIPMAKLPVVIDQQGAAIDCSVTVLPENSEAVRLVETNGKPITLGAGFVITEKLARLNGINKGDMVTMTIMNGKQAADITLQVADVCRSYVSQDVYVSYEALAQKGVSIPIYGYYMTLAQSVVSRDTADSVAGNPNVKNVFLKEDMIATTEDSMGILTMLSGIMFVASAILTLAVIFNITSINLFERRRDIATLRVLGSLLPKVNRLILTENLIITAFGSVFGVLVGFVMQYGIIHAVGTDDMDLPFRILWSSIPIAVVSVFLFTFAANLLLQKRVKSIDMVESLKSVE